MHIDIKSALVGGLITSIIGPLIVQEFTRQRSTSIWECTWHTATCNDGAITGFEFEIQFSQVGDHVAGPYAGSNEQSRSYIGHFVGTAGVQRLSGEWSSFSVQDGGGQFELVS